MILAAFTSTLLGTLYGLYAASKIRAQIEPKNILRIYLVSLLSAIPVLALQKILPLDGLALLVFGALLYFAMYLLLAPAMKVVTKPELEEAKTILASTKLLRTLTTPLFYFEETILSIL